MRLGRGRQHGYPFIFMFPTLAVTGQRPNLAVSLWGLTFIGIAAAVAVRVPPHRQLAAAERAPLFGLSR
jgi:hypothetical protein